MKGECLHNHRQNTADAVQRTEDVKLVGVEGEDEGAWEHVQSKPLRKYQVFSTWIVLFTVRSTFFSPSKFKRKHFQ